MRQEDKLQCSLAVEVLGAEFGPGEVTWTRQERAWLGEGNEQQVKSQAEMC